MAERKIEKYYSYYRRLLKNILRNLVEWGGLPVTYNESALNEQLLFKKGFVSGFIFKGDHVFCGGALTGLDEYELPVWFRSANPRIQPTQTRRIGEGCIICYNTTNEYYPETFNQMVDVYAWKLADIALSEEISIKNSRASYVPVVKDEKEALRWNRLMNEIYEGASTAIGFKIPLGQNAASMFLPLNARDNLIVDLLADARRSVMADFFSELGVKAIAVDKKERTNLAEMSSNDQQLKITSDIIMKPREKFCKAMNERFGLNMSVKFNTEEVEKYGILPEDKKSRSNPCNN